MSPFYFGRTARPLFGIYHTPRASVARREAAVLCSPVAKEHSRCHIALRDLGSQLADRGFHVLRFDHLGVGDSAGEPTEVRIESWLEDVGLAEREIRSLADVERVTLVGLRMGALLAASAAALGIARAESLVLWDPVVRGAGYLAELDALHTEAVATRSSPPAASDELFGFSFPAALREGIRTLELEPIAATLANRRLIVLISEDRPEYKDLRASLAGAAVDWRAVPEAGQWHSMRRAGTALLAGKTLRTIVTALSGAA